MSEECNKMLQQDMISSLFSKSPKLNSEGQKCFFQMQISSLFHKLTRWSSINDDVRGGTTPTW